MLKEQSTLFPYRYKTAGRRPVGLLMLFFVFLCLQFPQKKLSAQTVADSLVSFQVQNKAFGEVLENLYETYGLKVAFNASDPVFNKKISFSSNQLTPAELLSSLLDREGYSFRKIGEQYNVYKILLNENPSQEAPVESILSAQYDTVFIQQPVLRIDTLVLTDTIRQTDTLVIRDTVRIFVDKPVESRRARIKDVRKDIFDQDARRTNGTGIEIFYGREYVWPDFAAVDEESTPLADLWKDALNPSFRSQNLGLRWHRCSNKWLFSASLTYLDFAQVFKHNRIIRTGGYYDIDTLDSYYSIAGNDTSWFHVTDSVYLPLEESNYSYETTNRVGMLNLGVDVAYQVGQLPGVRFFARAGIGMSTVIYKKGFAFDQLPDYEVIDLKDLEFSPASFNFRLAFLAKMRLSDEFDLVPEVNWRMQLNDLFKDYPIQTKPSSVGISLGLVYYF
jgi:hypothetical protein